MLNNNTRYTVFIVVISLITSQISIVSVRVQKRGLINVNSVLRNHSKHKYLLVWSQEPCSQRIGFISNKVVLVFIKQCTIPF